MANNEFTIMHWNIHQQGRHGKRIPEWINEYLNADAVMLTEFNCKADNVESFYKFLKDNDYNYFTADHSECIGSNDVLIAVKKEYDVTGVFFTAYLKEKTLDNIPENLFVDIVVNKKPVTLAAVRIRILDWSNRKNQFDTLSALLNEKKNNAVILAGDFNNARYHGALSKTFKEVEKLYYKDNKKVLQYDYNLHSIRDRLVRGMGYKQIDSATLTKLDDKYISYDHIFVKCGDVFEDVFDVAEKGYKSPENRTFETVSSFTEKQKDIYKKPKNSDIYCEIEPGYPDHVIVKAILTLK